MKLHSADIVQVPQEGKETTTSLEIPNLDLVIITTRAKKWLTLMKVDTSYWAFVFLISIQKSPNAKVPKLNNSIVQ
jgi:hypothetical protein